MTIVVDTNIIAYLYLDDNLSVKATRAFANDSSWVAPFLWRSEFCNILSIYIRKKYLSVFDARITMDKALLLFKDREYNVSSYKVLDLIKVSNCSAYDCEFVALAQDLNVPLVTADKQILKEFPTTAISLENFILEKHEKL